MLTTLQITRMMERAIDEIKLIVHIPTKKDVTDQIKHSRGLILLNARIFLDKLERSKWAENIENALIEGFVAIIGFCTKLTSDTELGVLPRVKSSELEIIW